MPSDGVTRYVWVYLEIPTGDSRVKKDGGEGIIPAWVSFAHAHAEQKYFHLSL